VGFWFALLLQLRVTLRFFSDFLVFFHFNFSFTTLFLGSFVIFLSIQLLPALLICLQPPFIFPLGPEVFFWPTLRFPFVFCFFLIFSFLFADFSSSIFFGGL